MIRSNGSPMIPLIGATIFCIASYIVFRQRRKADRAYKVEKREVNHSDASTLDDSFEVEDTSFEVVDRLQRGTQVHRFEASAGSMVPDVALKGRVYFRTFGCSHNVSDSEFMMGLLVKDGYTLVNSLEESDLCVFNSCTVKNPSQDAAVNLVVKAEQLKRKIVVTGCVPQADQSIPIFAKASLVGVGNIDSIVHVVEETLKGNRVVAIGKSSTLPDINAMPKIRRNRLVEIIAVSTGCLGQCTYCKTKHARGELGSYSVEAIMARAETAIAEGVKQIWLTSEDLGAYGIDLGTDIVQLLIAILAVIEKAPDVMLRLGMTNPPYMLQHGAEVGRILSHPQVFEFLHAPVQSGSNAVLRAMKREYTKENYLELIDLVRETVPNLTIATDIICGFPGETNEDHEETISLIQACKFPVVNISQFYPRPGTPAAHMQRVPTKIAKQRSSQITTLFDSYTTNDAFLNTVVRVWFDETDEKDRARSQSVGHTKNYTKVIVPFQAQLAGVSRLVKITAIHKWDIRGVVAS